MNDENIIGIITVLVSAFVGAGLGFLVKSYFSRLEFRQSTIESIINRYLNARDEISSLVAECTVNADSENKQWLHDIREAISLAYYKYFDYMPNEVIKELICLQTCLKSKRNHLYKYQDRNIERVEESDLAEFCKSISTFENLAPILLMNLQIGPKHVIRNHRVEYQARQVLMNINRFFTEENLTSMKLFKPKYSYSRL